MSKYVRYAFTKALGLNGKTVGNRYKLSEIVEEVCRLATDGDLDAARIVFDRLDGKVATQLTVAGENDDKLVVSAITASMSSSDAAQIYRDRLKVIGGREVMDAISQRIDDALLVSEDGVVIERDGMEMDRDMDGMG